MIKEIFDELGFPEQCYRIYLRLMENGPSPARLLAENLNIPRPSIYDNLKILIQNNIVSEIESENKKIFAIDDPKNLPQLIRSKIENLKKKEAEIERILPDLAKNLQAVEPKIKFYSGAAGIKQVLTDMLWYDNLETYAFWPISEMVKVLGEEYIADFTAKKVRRKLWSHCLWPQDKLIDFEKYPFLGSSEEFLRDIRITPKEMTWDMSYWIYADKVAFISSHKESFGFVVHSRDFAKLQEAQFKQIWKISRPI
jgi:sugar-specific transcriptional regulator TrmB